MKKSFSPEILFLSSMEDGDSKEYRLGVAEITGGHVRYHGANEHEGTIPPLDFLRRFDCVMVHSWGANGRFENSTLMGDNLADFVDDGGTVVLSTHSTGVTSLKGRIITEQYSPVGGSVRWEHERDMHHEKVIYNGDGASILWKGIGTGFHPTHFRDTEIHIHGDGISDGTFADSVIATAYRPDFRVVYLNGASCDGGPFTPEFCPAGVHLKRWANACTAAGPNVNRIDFYSTRSGPSSMTLFALSVMIGVGYYVWTAYKCQILKLLSKQSVDSSYQTVAMGGGGGGARSYGDYVELSPVEEEGTLIFDQQQQQQPPTQIQL
eukprot:CAMPEP_0194027164 /NCGR_PEP_ID=MMETSP0009_2-20130614/1365_1 /TAXON_ID=210454 /ORGANISM="Grammatophora oceanica, Strain CCMP 410" /LENGTH=321 /DNA_ID=CAMNT_0038666129 /DNA_START=82 /DNA_END=1047 /DNA_ORIENTATION=+